MAKAVGDHVGRGVAGGMAEDNQKCLVYLLEEVDGYHEREEEVDGNHGKEEVDGHHGKEEVHGHHGKEVVDGYHGKEVVEGHHGKGSQH